MNLFYANLSPEEQLKKLSSDILNSVTTRKKTLNTVNLNLNNIGNLCLFVFPHVTLQGFGKDTDVCDIISLTKKYNLDKVGFTYSYLFPTENVSRNQIKEFTPWIDQLIEIVKPKLLVSVGENSTLSFFNRKIKIEKHGTQIGCYGEIPILLTLEPSYYSEHSAYEDAHYKSYIKNKDWIFIKEKYDAYI